MKFMFIFAIVMISIVILGISIDIYLEMVNNNKSLGEVIFDQKTMKRILTEDKE